MSEAPYLIVSDIHAHKWSAFSTVNEDGVNSRLQIIIDELKRAAQELLDRGGHNMFIAGDLFHVRGSIDPEVFNPVHEAFQGILAKGVFIWAIPGNHDLVGKDTTALGNAFQSLGALDNFLITTDWSLINVGGTTTVAMVPWQANKTQLRLKIAQIAEELTSKGISLSDIDLIIHVGIDGVLTGVPDSGLSAAEVAGWGFKRVFAGDYHNHKVMEDGKVVSIGATTHQQWGDIGSQAGFLLVYPDRLEFCASHAPSFIEITGDDDPEEIPLLVDDNYVRIRGLKLTDSEINTMRAELEEMGACGVTFQVTREVVSARSGSTLAKASTLDESVDKYIDGLSLDEDLALMTKESASDILSTIRSVTI
jgi:DNA repair exonuclease SbcCD nuclease subunit